MNLFFFLQMGGFLMYPLLLIAFINTALIFHLLSTLLIHLKNLRLIRKDITVTNDLIRSLQEAANRSGKRKFWTLFSERINVYERRIHWLSSLSGLSTLSGLLGTVIGIYISFQNMKQIGSASAEVFADGISVALLTTIAGLMIAIPSIFSFYILRHLLELIEEQSYNYLFKDK